MSGRCQYCRILDLVFFLQLVAHLPWNAVEIIGFLKYVRNVGLFAKNVEILKKKYIFSQNR